MTVHAPATTSPVITPKRLSDFSNMWESIAVTVISAALLGLVAWLWTRRHSPTDWVAAGRAKFGRRQRQRVRANHEELVRSVLRRAEVLDLSVGQDLPIKVSGISPTVVTYHPTGRTFAFYPDISSYKAAATSGQVNPANAHFGKPPKVISSWSQEQLRIWLSEHADRLPPER